MKIINTKVNKTVYLIDYENVHVNGLDGLYNLGKCDEVVVFTNKSLPVQLPLDLVSNTCNAQIRIEVCTVGVKNGLDFQLSSYLGYLIGTRKNVLNYVIVSKDQAFKLIVDYWSCRMEEVNCYLVDSISDLGQKLLDCDDSQINVEVNTNSKEKATNKMDILQFYSKINNEPSGKIKNKILNSFVKIDLETAIKTELKRAKLNNLDEAWLKRCVIENEDIVQFHNNLRINGGLLYHEVYTALKPLHMTYWSENKRKLTDCKKLAVT